MKVVIANYLAANIVDEVFGAPGQHSSLEVLVGIYALRRPDLRGLLRLHEHGDRDRAPPRLPLPAELRRAVHGDLDPGLLAPLAHDALALAPRLRLHPARREPRKPALHLPQPDADDADRRALARGRLDVRRLGRDPRRRRSSSSAGGGSVRATPASGRRPWRRAAQRLVTFQVVCFAWIFFRADSFADARDVIVQALHRLGRALAARHRRRARRDRRRDRLPVPPAPAAARRHGAVLAAARAGAGGRPLGSRSS